MRKAWKVIIAIVLVMVILGCICTAVGFLTGADITRMMQTAENNNQLNLMLQYVDWIGQCYEIIVSSF